LTAVLVSPHFLFRAEGSAKPGDSAAIYDLNDFELASRLSYFLWSSMPDRELSGVASHGKLHDEATLESQIRRLLAAAKSDALVQNFVTQWLNLRLLDGVAPDPQVFPQFDAELKAAMRRTWKERRNLNLPRPFASSSKSTGQMRSVPRATR